MRRTIYSPFTDSALGTTSPILTQAEIEAIASEVANAASDDVLSPTEKIRILIPRAQELSAIATNLISLAMAVDVDYSALSTAKSAFENYLNSLDPAWNDTTQSTTVVRSTLNSLLEDYTDAIWDLQGKGAISNSLEDLDPAAALTLSEIVSDGVLSTAEKTSLVLEHKRAMYQWAELDAKATSLGGYPEQAAATSAKNNLNSYLDSLIPDWDNTTVNTPIADPSNFRSLWDTFYSAIANLDAAITAQPGEPAKAIVVISDTQQVRYDGNDQLLSGQVVNFSIEGQNLSTSTKIIKLFRMNSNGSLTQLDAGTYITAGSGFTDNTPDVNSFTQTGNTFSLTGTNFNNAMSTGRGVVIEVSHADGVSNRTGILKIKDGSSGTSSSPAFTAYLTVPVVQIPAYSNGVVATNGYAQASGQIQVFQGSTDVTAGCTFGVSSNPQGLTGPNAGSSLNTATGAYSVTGGLDAGEDSASITYTFTHTATGATGQIVFTLTKLKGGYENVTALPTTNLYEGRQVFNETDDTLYIVKGGAWVSMMDAERQIQQSQLPDGVISAAKMAAGLDVPRTFTGTLPSVKTGQLIVNSSTGQTYQWNGTEYRPLIDDQDAIPAVRISGQLQDTQIQAVSATKVSGQLTDAQLAGLQAAKLTGQITSVQIGNDQITAPKIAGGQIVTSHIAASAITGEKLSVGTLTDNLIINPRGTDGTAGWLITSLTGLGGDFRSHPGWLGTGTELFVLEKADATSGLAALGKAFKVVPGRAYSVKLRIYGSATTANGLYIRIHSQAGGVDANGYISGGYVDLVNNGPVIAGYSTYEFQWVAPYWHHVAAFSIYNWTLGPSWLAFTDVEVRELVDTVRIEDGAVIADKVAANAIEAQHVKANSIDTSKLTISPGNLIGNGDFATGDFSNWSKWNYPEQISVHTYGDTGNVSQKSMRFTHPGNGVAYDPSIFASSKAYDEIGAESDGIEVEPGQTYRISFYAHQSGGLTTNTSTALSVLFWGYLNGGPNWNATVATVPTAALSGAWQKFTGELTIPYGVSRIWPYFYVPGYTAGSIFVSKVVVTQKASAELIVNGAVIAEKIASGAVETDKLAANAVTAQKVAANEINVGHLKVTGVGAALNDDPNCIDLSAWTVSPSGQATVVNDNTSPTGSAIRFAASGSIFTNKPIPIDNTKNYDLRMWYKQESGSSTAYLAVAFYDKTGAQITGSGDATGWPSGGTFAYFGLVGNTAPSTWTEYRISFGPNETAKIPSNAAFVRVGALTHYTVSSAGWQRMANVRLVEKTSADLLVPGSVIAGKIAAGAVSATAIAANSIRTDHLSVATQTDNLITNPAGYDGTAGWTILGANAGTTFTGAPNFFDTGRPGFGLYKGATTDIIHVASRKFRVEPGKTYAVKGYFSANNTFSSGMYVRINYTGAEPATNYVPAGSTYTDVYSNGSYIGGWAEWTWTAPAGAHWASLEIYNYVNAATALYFGHLEFREQKLAVHIADGAIVADKLAANAVTASKIDAGAVTAGKINVTDLSAITANLGTITAGLLSGASGNHTWNLNTGRRKSVKGGYRLVDGTDLTDMVLWYGPTTVAEGSETRTNGVFALGTDGKVYYGSSELTNQEQLVTSRSWASQTSSVIYTGKMTQIPDTGAVRVHVTGAVYFMGSSGNSIVNIQVQTSIDGTTWNDYGSAWTNFVSYTIPDKLIDHTTTISGLTNGQKIHVRLKTWNSGTQPGSGDASGTAQLSLM